MTDDLDLLKQFSCDHSQDAFVVLVNRHLNLVYSAARRQVRSPQLAEEVAQSVFTDLARHAGRLKPDTLLTAWLYQVTRRTAIDMVRKESRRQRREQIAVEMNTMNATIVDWTHIEPFLDEAMAAIDDSDRTAVLLRYFENKSFRDVGQTLGLSEDTAQKRVSRAVERLRDFFTKRKVTVGAGGLAVLISTNAIQAAPVGLAATISAAAVLAGTAVSTSTVITAIKTIAMTTLQKTLVTATVAVLAGAGIYEAHQAARLREQNQTLQQSQAPLTEQIQQLQRERNDATNRLASLADEIASLKRNTAELLKLRGEAARLKNNPLVLNPADASNAAAAKSWLNRVGQLKQYVEQNPNEKIPEFQFLTDREWLNTADAGLGHDDFQTEDEYRRAMESLRFQAEGRFGNLVQIALREYSSANNGQFPNNLSQLEPYCEPVVMDTLRELYEIKPANILPERVREDTSTKFDWVITRKQRVNSNSTSRLAIFAYGNTYWQSPP